MSVSLIALFAAIGFVAVILFLMISSTRSRTSPVQPSPRGNRELEKRTPNVEETKPLFLKGNILFILGILLIVVTLALGAVQHFKIYDIYGTYNKWYFYGPVGAVGLIGIVLAVWALIKK